MLSNDEVKHIASLARLEVSEEEVENLAKDLSAVLGYVEKLNVADTKDAEITMNASMSVNVFRDDENPDEPNEYIAMKLVGSAPLSEDNYVKVKSIL